MKHVIALSGGKDSTALALRLSEIEPRDYEYVCTPTGNELPQMFAHWRKLGDLFGKQITPIMHNVGLFGLIRSEQMIPNFRARFCTRKLKIEPYERWLAANAPCISYVGLRADEETRQGGIYDHIVGVEMRFPLREWGWTEADVWAYLRERNIDIPRRTDCAVCYHQRLIEWHELWRDHLDEWMRGEAIEAELGHTFRSPGRDTWPVAMKDMRMRFEAGEIPRDTRRTRDRMGAGGCRVCSI